MQQRNQKIFSSIATSDVDQVALEWEDFSNLVKIHHLGIFVQSECFKRHGHFDVDTLGPAQKLNLIHELQDAIGYAVLQTRVRKNGNSQKS